MAQLLDRGTVETIYRRYGAQVERCCRRILRDSDEASDAAQEVFLRLFTQGAAFRAEAEWMTWLYRVSTNLCLNRLRDDTKHRHLLEHHGDPVRPNAAFDPSVLEDRQMLQVLLDGMDHKTQEIALYYYIHELSQQEIGELVGMSRVSVNKRLRKFEKHAQTLLDESRAA